MKTHIQDMKPLMGVCLLLAAFSMPLLPLEAVAQQAPAQAQEQTWKVNLKDADIRAFVTQVADITGYSFVVDPRVKGKVTVISQTPMTRDGIYELFLSVLQVHGFAAIPSEGVIKIVQQNDAKQLAESESYLRQVPSEQLVTRVIEVKNGNALELVPILRPMVAKYGHLAGVAAANSLIISDHVSNIDRISRLVRELDSPSSYELDVVQLEHAWVGDLVKMLQELAPSELGQTAQKGQAAKFSVVADERSNRLLIKGDDNFRVRIRDLVYKLDQPAVSSGTTQVIRLRHADAKTMAELLRGLMGQMASATGTAGTSGTAAAAPRAAGRASTGNGDFGIYADEGLNALVVRADPAMMTEVQRVIAELDVRRAQVLIEAIIVEISDNLNRGIGVQWAAADLSGDSGPLGGTSFENVGVSMSDLLAALATDNLIAPENGGITLGGGRESSNGLSFGVLVQALSNTTGANLLSTPSIITMDNQESEIIVGQNVPFVTGSTTTTGDGLTNPFTTIEREDVGLTLRVTPTISEGNLVRLQIEQETSSIADAVNRASDIITNKRQIKTAVLADNGETIVLGGLINDNYSTQVSKVPLLGDIPVLGHLFRSTNVRREKTNLLVFLRPTILRDKEAATEATRYKYDGLWELNLKLQNAEEPVEKPELETLYRTNSLNLRR